VGCSDRNSYRIAGFERQDGNRITFDLRNGNQRIKATCNASQSECSNLALRAGSSVDCYRHPKTTDSISGSYDVKIDFYETESGIVCHASEGRGKLFLVHTQKCAEMKQLNLILERGTIVVTDKKNVIALLSDPQYKALSDADKPEVLERVNGIPVLRGDENPGDALFDGVSWTAYVPVAFSNGEIQKYLQELNDARRASLQPATNLSAGIDRSKHQAGRSDRTEDPYASIARPSRNAPASVVDNGIITPDAPQTAKRGKATAGDIWDQAAARTVPNRQVIPDPLPLLPTGYKGYTASDDNPLRFCGDEKVRYLDERGKEVQDDTVLLTVAESTLEKR